MLMSIDERLEVELFFIEGDDPFICGVRGYATIDIMEEIEQDCCENIKEIFTNGSGSYLFYATHSQAQIGDAGRIEIPSHWELALTEYKPLKA